MADEKVDIKLKVEVIDKELKALIAKIKALEAAEKRLSSGAKMQQYMKNMSSSAGKWKKSFDTFDTAVKMTGKALTKFLTLAIKGVIIEMALLSATMLGVHALFAAGRFLIKAYNGAMSLLAGGAAVLGTAIAAVSAAIREQQAAMYAYRGKGAAEFGSAMNQTRMAMRNLQADASLASLGVENLNKAYGVMSKTMNVAQINASGKAIKALMDFGSAGQDPAQAMEAVATVVAALSDQKKGVNEVISAAQKLGPEMQKALKDAKVKTKDQFRELLFSGDLAKMGGVAGQFDAVNNTLINVLKGYFTQIRTLFADLGDQFLEPLKVAFQRIFWSIQSGVTKMAATIESTIGFDGVIGGLANVVEKLVNWMVRFMREYLPGIIGMFGKISDWWDRFVDGWNRFTDKLRPLEQGAKTIVKAFTPIWEAIKRGADNLFLMNDLLVKNEVNAVEFGQRIADLIDTLSDLFMNMKMIFAEIAPFINDVLKGLNDIFKMFSKILTLGAGKGFATALAPLLAMGIIGRKMGSTRGGLIPSFGQSAFKQMTVNAANVNINGQPMMGPVGAGRGYGPGTMPTGGAPGGGFSSGAKFSSGAGGAGGAGQVPGLMLHQRGQSYLSIAGMNQVANIPAATAISQGQQILTRQMNLPASIANRQQKNAAARAAYDAQMATYNATTPQQRQQAAQQLAVNNAPGMMSPGLRAQINPQLQQTAMTRNQILRQYLGTRARNAYSGAKERTVYGARSVVGATRGFFGGYLSGPSYDPTTGQWTNPAASRQAAREHFMAGVQKDPQTGQPINDPRSRFTRRLAMMKTLNRINRTETRFGAGQQRFGQSMTGRMGTSMGLAMASQYAPEEMRGAMALGGMAAQIDPRLGIAVAGVGGALTAKSAGAGALAGLAGGAQIGATIGGPYGALIGGIIGGVVGGISGSINKGNEDLKRAREAAKATISSLYSGIIASATGSRFARNRELVESGKRVGGRGTMQGMGARLNQGRSRLQQDLLAGFASGRFRDTINTSTGGNSSTEFGTQQAVRYLYENQKNLGITISKKQMEDASKTGLTSADYLRTLGIDAKKVIAGDKDVARRASDITGLTADEKAKQTAFRGIDAINDQRIAQLTKMTGKSGAELEVLAKELGVNLYDPTVKFTDLVGKLGVVMVKTAGQLNDELTDIVIAGGEYFRKLREQREAVLAIDASSRGLADKLRTGGLTGTEATTEIEAYGEQAFAQILAASGGNAAKAYLTAIESFGAGTTAGAFAPGEVFAGLGGQIAPVMAPALAQMKEGYAQSRAGAVSALLYEAGFTGDTNQIQRAIGNMSPEKVKDLETFLSSGMSVQGYTAENMATRLGSLGLEGVTFEDKTSVEEALNAMGNVDKAAEKMGISADQLKNGIAEFNTAMAPFFSGEKPMQVYVQNHEEIRGGDTRTPRGDTTSSRLSQTMGRHAQFDSMLTGNRTVTSSYRNFGLGSINSDHVMGRAYDLTGQNLGQYAKLVHDNGGFAEFHGSNANRHLHVVPGIGDTAMPAMPARMTNMTGGGGGNTNYYNIEINGTNQSPEQIANMVVAKLDQRERSVAERI
jgi:hypothetical protein